jgi:hypothetical protein
MFWRLRTIGFSAIGLFFHAGIDRAPQRRRVIVRKHVEAGGATSKRPWLATGCLTTTFQSSLVRNTFSASSQSSMADNSPLFFSLSSHNF